MTELACGNNQLTTLDLRPVSGLTVLGCGNNQLSTLDLRPVSGLTVLGCRNNKLTAIDLRPVPGLTQIYCEGNPLTILDVRPTRDLRDPKVDERVEIITLDERQRALTNASGVNDGPDRNLLDDFCSDPEIHFYVAPNLPAQKVRNFIKEFNSIEIDESSVILYFDNTVFGRGNYGIMVDSEKLLIKEQFVDARQVPLISIKTIDISGFINREITCNLFSGQRFSCTLTQSNKGAYTFCEALRRIIGSIKR